MKNSSNMTKEQLDIMHSQLVVVFSTADPPSKPPLFGNARVLDGLSSPPYFISRILKISDCNFPPKICLSGRTGTTSSKGMTRLEQLVAKVSLDWTRLDWVNSKELLRRDFDQQPVKCPPAPLTNHPHFHLLIKCHTSKYVFITAHSDIIQI